MHVSTDMILASAPGLIPAAYRFNAKADEAEIYIYGDIGDSWFGGVTAKQFADDLKAAGSVSKISLRINSFGGDVFQGLTMYRLLVEHKAKVTVHIDGMAASIASIIAMAGDEIMIAEAAQLMIHEAWALAMGNAADLRQMADLLETTSASLRDVYVARTGIGAEEVAKMMSDETWMTATVAVERGFADKVAENLRVAAKYDPAKHKFKNAPAALAGTPNVDAARARIAQMKARIQRHAAA